jgi:hypothetical protein
MRSLCAKTSVSGRFAPLLSLAFLAPNLVKAAVNGRLPSGFGVSRLINLPIDWDEQRRLLGLTPSDERETRSVVEATSEHQVDCREESYRWRNFARLSSLNSTMASHMAGELMTAGSGEILWTRPLRPHKKN